MQPTMQFVPIAPNAWDIRAYAGKAAYCQSPHCYSLSNKGLLLDGDPYWQCCLQISPCYSSGPEDAEKGLSSRMRRIIAELYDLFNDLGRRIIF